MLARAVPSLRQSCAEGMFDRRGLRGNVGSGPTEFGLRRYGAREELIRAHLKVPKRAHASCHLLRMVHHLVACNNAVV
jgi:hypothetical protein